IKITTRVNPIRSKDIPTTLFLIQITLVLIGTYIDFPQSAWDPRGLRGFAWDEKDHPTRLINYVIVSYKPCVACVG
ncbi:MAG: hypothetical protein M0P00_05845, partial [Bacteroidaceae bacterium]|nr:hypothetical protein [Bacteroidaceae bacterium]